MFKQTIIFAAVAGLVFALAPAAQAGLVSHWTFDSNLTDSASTNHGAAVGNAAVSAADKMIGAGSVLLDGSGDFVNIAGSSGGGHELDITGAVTLSAWVNTDNESNDYQWIYSRGSHCDGYGLGYNKNSGKKFCDEDSTVSTTVASSNTWYHVAKTSDGSGNHVLYINGVEEATGSGHTAPSNTKTTKIGAEGFQSHSWTSDNRWHFEGNIDDVGVWNSNEGADTIALINGLGRTGAIGLDQIDEAQALWAGSLGDTATIGGAPWQKVSGLSGSLGDWGGSVAGVDAYIVLDNSGNGVKVIPEPATMVLLGLGGIGLLLRRRRRS